MERWEMGWGAWIFMWLRSLTSFVIGSHMQLIVYFLYYFIHRQRRVSTDQLHRLPA